MNDEAWDEREDEPLSSSTVPKDCPDAAAVYELLNLMGDLSEEYYAAGWLIGLEQDLWKLAFEDPHSGFGFGNITHEERGKLIELSHRCQGWWVWDRTVGRRFISLDDWLVMYQDDVRE